MDTDTHERIWMKCYNDLGEFIIKYDRFPKKYDGHLFNWINVQKLHQTRGILSEEKIELLERMYFWEWNKNSNTWHDDYYELMEHVKTYNSMPKIGVSRLSKWMHAQRRLYVDNKLSQDRIDLLEKIPNWSWVMNVVADPWDVSYRQLESFIGKTGEYPNANNTSTGYQKRLIKWTSAQKRLYILNKLSRQKMTKLEKLKNWNTKVVKTWEENYIALAEFIQKNGELPQKETDFELDKWIITQMTNHKNGILPEEKINMLEKFPGWTWKIEWKKMYDRIKKHCLKKGTFQPAKEVTSWIEAQKTSFQEKTLTDHEIILLEKLPNWTWSSNFGNFQNFNNSQNFENTQSSPILPIFPTFNFSNFIKFPNSTISTNSAFSTLFTNSADLINLSKPRVVIPVYDSSVIPTISENNNYPNFQYLIDESRRQDIPNIPNVLEKLTVFKKPNISVKPEKKRKFEQLENPENPEVEFASYLSPFKRQKTL